MRGTKFWFRDPNAGFGIQFFDVRPEILTRALKRVYAGIYARNFFFFPACISAEIPSGFSSKPPAPPGQRFFLGLRSNDIRSIVPTQNFRLKFAKLIPESAFEFHVPILAGLARSAQYIEHSIPIRLWGVFTTTETETFLR